MPEVRDPLRGKVTTADLADELGVRPETVVRWCREHRLTGAFRAGGRWYVAADSARAFASDYRSHDEE